MHFIYTLAFRDAHDWPVFARHTLPSVGLAFSTLVKDDLLPPQWIKGPLGKYGSKVVSATLLAFVREDWGPPGNWVVHVVVAFCEDQGVRSALGSHLHELVLDGWKYLKRSEPDGRHLHSRQYIAILSS